MFNLEFFECMLTAACLSADWARVQDVIDILREMLTRIRSERGEEEKEEEEGEE